MQPDEALRRVIAGQDLSLEQTEKLFGSLMDGAWNDAQKAALLAALATKGEASGEIAGAATAMRDRVVRIPHHQLDVVDVGAAVGPGGARVEDVARHAWNVRRHVEAEDRVLLVGRVPQRAVEDR